MRSRLLTSAALLSVSLAASASGVTLVNGQLQSTVDESYAMNSPSPNGLVTSTGSTHTSTSTTSGSASAAGAAFTFTQTFGGEDFAAGGSASADFNAGSGVTYSITDAPATFTSAPLTTDSFDTTLTDLTTNSVLYDTNSGGSLTGALVYGNEYSFSSSASIYNIQSDPSLTYSPLILFTSTTAPSVTPEPSSLLLLATGLASAAGALRKRFF